jgi:hypothetical protein
MLLADQLLLFVFIQIPELKPIFGTLTSDTVSFDVGNESQQHHS